MRTFALAKQKRLSASLNAFEEDDVPGGPPPSEPTRDLQELGTQAASRGEWSLALRYWDEALLSGQGQAHILHEQRSQVRPGGVVGPGAALAFLGGAPCLRATASLCPAAQAWQADYHPFHAIRCCWRWASHWEPRWRRSGPRP